MKTLGKFLAVMLLIVSVPADLFADESPVDQFPQGLGLAAGLGSGVGLSYRHLDSQSGFQVTGIVFLPPGAGTQDPLNYSLGVGWLHPLGVFLILDGLHVVPYLQLSTAVMGSQSLQGGYSGVSALAAGSVGVELLLWSHFAVSLEVAQTQGVSSGYRFVHFDALLLPQLALYFRY